MQGKSTERSETRRRTKHHERHRHESGLRSKVFGGLRSGGRGRVAPWQQGWVQEERRQSCRGRYLEVDVGAGREDWAELGILLDGPPLMAYAPEQGGGVPRGGGEGPSGREALGERGSRGKSASLMGYASSGRRCGESGFTLFSGFPGKRRSRKSKTNQNIWVGFSLIFI